MRWPWPWPPWSRWKPDRPQADDHSPQALEDSQLILETARLRWHRINETAERAEKASEKVRSQRDQNHLSEIVFNALHGGRKALDR